MATIGDEASGVLVLDRRLDHMLVYTVAVEPRHQRFGFGAALPAFADQRALACDLGELRLYTNRRTARNVRLYKRCGFVAVAERPHPSRAGEFVIDMIKQVSRDPRQTSSAMADPAMSRVSEPRDD